MMTIETIFQTIGGPAALARAVGVTTEHAATMKRRKSIPVRYWPALIEFARENGIRLTESDLINAHAHQPAQRGAAA